MAEASFGISWLWMTMMLGLPGWLGLPPGDRDRALEAMAPENSIFYSEWSNRSTGAAGGVGLEGMIADPEWVQFAEAFERSIHIAFERIESEKKRETARAALGMMKIVSRRAGCIILSPPTPDHPDKDSLLPPAAIALSLNDDCDEFMRLANLLLKDVEGVERSNRPKMQALALPAPWNRLNVIIHREGQRVIFANHEWLITFLLHGLEQRHPGLDGNERFQAALKEIPVEKMGSCGWIDCALLRRTLLPRLGLLAPLIDHGLVEAGLGDISTMTWANGSEKGRIVSRTFLATGGSQRGILKLCQAAPLTPAQLKRIPTDADFAALFSIRPANVLETIKDLPNKIAPGTGGLIDNIIDQFEGATGISVGQEIIPSLGDTVLIYNAPSHGGLLYTGMTFVVDIRNPQTAHAVLAQINKAVLRSIENKSLKLTEHKFSERSIFTIEQVRPTQLSENISYCLTDRELIVALNPQQIRAHLRSVAPPAEAESVNAMSGGKTTAIFVNTPRLYEVLIGVLPQVSNRLLEGFRQRTGVSLNAVDLPSAKAILPYLDSAGFTISPRANGVVLESRECWPLSALPFIFAASQYSNLPGPSINGVIPASNEVSADSNNIRKEITPIVRDLVPPGIRLFIPDETWKKIEAGPSAEERQKREDERQKRLQERKDRRESRSKD